MTSVSGMVYLIDRMLARCDFEPVMICDNAHYETNRFRVIHYGEYRPQKEATRDRETFFGKEKRTWRHQAHVFFRELRTCISMSRRCKALIREVGPDAVVTADDRVMGLVQGLLKQAKGIPVISVPVAISTLVQFDMRYHNLELEVPSRGMDVNRLAIRFNPDWAQEREGSTRLFYPAGMLLAGALTGMVPRHPWACGSNENVTCAMVSNEADKESILRYGKKDVRVTGLIEEYAIGESRRDRDTVRKRLKETYDLSGDAVVILSMPHFPEHGFATWDDHRHNMTLLADALQKRYGRFLISLHPKSKREDYFFLREVCDALFADEPLRTILAGADILVAESSTSVLRWGKILGISLIILPMNQYMRRLDGAAVTEQIIEDSLQGRVSLLPPFRVDSISDIAEEIMKVLEARK